MPKVKMIQSMAGVTFSYAPDDEIEVTDEVAQAWVDASIAVLVVEEKPLKGDE